MARNPGYYSEALIVQFIKLKLSMKILAAIKKSLIILIIRLSQNTTLI